MEGDAMDDQTERLERLEQQMRRLRGTARVQAAALVVVLGGLVLGAPSEPQALKVRKLTIVDAEGKARIAAGTDPDGNTVLELYDREGGNGRIKLVTFRNGEASLGLSDRSGTMRIA